jgi:hypothetical protein
MAEQTEAYKQAKEARDETISGTNNEFGYYSQLVDELSNITEENGKVKKGYEDRAATITKLLSDALGEEISLDQLVADGKQKVIDKIEKLIQTKRAEAQLQANESAYTEAIQNSTSALNDYMKAQDNVKIKAEEVAEAENKVAEAYKKYNEETNPRKKETLLALWEQEKTSLASVKGEYDKCNETLTNTQQKYLDYQNIIKNYEGVSSAVISGDSTKINDALLLLTNNFITAENGTKASLENQVKNAQTNLKNLETALKQGAPGVTQQMVDNAKTMVDKAVAEMDKLTPQGEEKGKKGGEAFAKGVDAKKGESEKSGKNIAESSKKGAGSVSPSNEGTKFANDYIGSVDSKKGEASTSGKNLTLEVKKGAAAVSPKAEGTQAVKNYVDGIVKQRLSVNTEGKNTAEQGKKGLGSVKTTQTGLDFGQGFINGISTKKDSSSLWDTAWGLGKKALSALKEAIDSNSPAKETIGEGENFGEGFFIGIDNLVNKCKKIAVKLGEKTLNALIGVTEEAEEEMLESEKFYLAEKERLEKEAEEKEYQEKLKAAKNAKEIEKIKQEKINAEAKKQQEAYLDGLKEAAEKEKKERKKAAEEEKKALEERKKQYETFFDGITDFFNDSLDDALKKIEDLGKVQEKISDKFNDYGNKTFQTITFANGSEVLGKEYRLFDMSKDNALLSEFSSMLDSLSEKRGILPNAVANLLSEMGLEEGKSFVTALLNASDEEYNKYLDNLKQRENLADKISKQVTTTQSEELQKELSEQFSKTPLEFFNIGSDSIANFGESFIKGLGDVLASAKWIIRESLADLDGVDINEVINNGLSMMRANLSGVNSTLSGANGLSSGQGPIKGGTVNNYTQIINSPTAPNRVDLYRNTKNLLGLAGG